jgi:hypothetical protein
MCATSKYHHKILLFILGILTLPLLSNPSADSPRIFITTQDMVNCRRILLQFSEPVEMSEIRKPQIRSDPQNGTFEFILPDFNSARYFGLHRIVEKGIHPLSINVNSTGKEYLAIIGNTLPYYSIETSYAFDQDAYLFDIFWEKPPESVTFEYGAPGSLNGDQTISLPDHQTFSHLKYSLIFYKNTIVQALLIGSTVFAGFIILFIILKSKRSLPARAFRIKEKDIKVLKDSIQNDNPESETPQFDEAVIQSLSENRGISYDEAALLMLNAERSK